MSIFSRWFGGAKFNDEQLAARARQAIAEDPLIGDPTLIIVTSKGGVVTLSGPVQKAPERDRIEGVVRNALRHAGLKFERLINDLKVAQTSG